MPPSTGNARRDPGPAGGFPVQVVGGGDLCQQPLEPIRHGQQCGREASLSPVPGEWPPADGAATSGSAPGRFAQVVGVKAQVRLDGSLATKQ